MKIQFSERCDINSNELFAADLIKKHELEKDEFRPLYMDFQATTPMVTITPISEPVGGIISGKAYLILLFIVCTHE